MNNTKILLKKEKKKEKRVALDENSGKEKQLLLHGPSIFPFGRHFSQFLA